MSVIRAVLFASLAIGFVVTPLVTTPTLAGDGSIHPPSHTLMAPSNATNESTDAPLGSRISGFMQQQSSQASGAVESGMWAVTFDNASDRSTRVSLVDQQTTGIQNDLDAIKAEKQELIAARERGEISQLEFQSRMSGLVGRYVSLLDAVNQTQPRAEQAGVNVSAVEKLREKAKQAAGPEITAAAGRKQGGAPPGLTPSKMTPNKSGGSSTSNAGGNAPFGNTSAGNASNGNEGPEKNPGNANGTGSPVKNVSGNGQNNGTHPGQNNGANSDQNNGQGSSQSTGQGPSINLSASTINISYPGSFTLQTNWLVATGALYSSTQ